MVCREVDGPLWAVLGRSRGLCGRSWTALGAGVGGLGPLSGLCGRSWAALGASVDGLGLLSGPLAAVLGRSQGLCGRSWAVSGPLWAVLARDQAEKWPFLEREGDQDRGSGREVALSRAGAGL